ncbi:MAG: hypothetical protein WCP58_02525 [bacterium]
MDKYCDYLDLRQDFIPFFSEEADKQNARTWKFFVPHDHFIAILEILAKALERGSAQDKKSLWVQGPYGTGKTFASFVLKHILEDERDEVEDYFHKHELDALWPRFAALKEGRRLTVYRSSAGEITSTFRLLVQIQETIKKRLLDQGLDGEVGDTFHDKILHRLTDEGGLLNWQAAFTRYRGQFPGIATAEEVIERMKDGDTRISAKVAAVLESEGIVVMETPDELKIWIRKVIERNALKSLVFIWDEFTDFFANKVPLSTLQEIAHATVEMPFYFLLITHRSGEQLLLGQDDESAKKLLDRFHCKQLEMSEVTAYKLIANVIEAKPERSHEWEAIRERLWRSVGSMILQLMLRGEMVRQAELKSLAPIHPYTAFLLTVLSRQFSSSQRTLFQFLKSDDPNGFQGFAAHYPEDGWNWLTADSLWDYFLEDPNLEIGAKVQNLLGHFHLHQSKISSPGANRLFRLILLLLSLSMQTRSNVPLLVPSRENLSRAYKGTPLEGAYLQDALQELVEKELIRIDTSQGEERYLIPLWNVDEQHLKELIRQCEVQYPLEKILCENDAVEAGLGTRVVDSLSLSLVQKARHPCIIASADELKRRRERLLTPLEPWQVGLLIVAPLEETELAGAEEIAQTISANTSDWVIAVSQEAFGLRRWESWLEQKARAAYMKETKEAEQQRYHQDQARQQLIGWMELFQHARVRRFFGGKAMDLANPAELRESLKEIASQVFYHGPEQFIATETLYRKEFGITGAQYGLNLKEAANPYKEIVLRLQNLGVWQEEKGYEKNPSHPVSQMRAFVDGLFTTRPSVPLKEVWQGLKCRPFGLWPSPIGIMLFAFLMGKYAEGYYWQDGARSFALNPDKMATLIHQVITDKRGTEDYLICKMSVEAETFCRFLKAIFRLPENTANYPQESVTGVRIYLKVAKFPLWALEHSLRQEGMPGYERVISVFRNLNLLIGGAEDREEIAEEKIKALVEEMRFQIDALSRYVNPDRFRQGMEVFFRELSPDYPQLMERIGLSLPQLMERMGRLLNEDAWLWQEQEVAERFPELLMDMTLTDALNQLTGIRKQSLAEARESYRQVSYLGKLPLLAFLEGQSEEVCVAIKGLLALVYKEDRSAGGSLDFPNQLTAAGQAIRILLRDPVGALHRLVELWFPGQCMREDVEELYREMPKCAADDSVENLRIMVEAQMERLQKQQAITWLRSAWRERADETKSPSDWSDQRQMPIQWILSDPAFIGFFEKIENLGQQSLEALHQMKVLWETHGADLCVLTDKEAIDQAYLSATAGDYADLLRDSEALQALKKYVFTTIGKPVYGWPARHHLVLRAVREYVSSRYIELVKPKLTARIKRMHLDKLRVILQNLADDASVGSRLWILLKDLPEAD